MNQRTQGVGSAAHCGSARSPLLGPGAEHLSHKKEVREAAGSRPLEPAHLQPGTGVLGTDRKLRPRVGRGRFPPTITLHVGHRLVWVNLHEIQGGSRTTSPSLTLCMATAGRVRS